MWSYFTYRTFIFARSQKAPSVSLLMLFLCSFSTSRLDRPWKVKPSTWRIRFLFSSLQGGQTDIQQNLWDGQSPTFPRSKEEEKTLSYLDWEMFCPYSTATHLSRVKTEESCSLHASVGAFVVNNPQLNRHSSAVSFPPVAQGQCRMPPAFNLKMSLFRFVLINGGTKIKNKQDLWY